MRGALIALFGVVLGCGEDTFNRLPDAPVFDDAGDAALDPDGATDGSSTPDSDPRTDGSLTPDSATPDSATVDSSTPDSSTPDSSTPDSATVDSSTPDSSTPDSSTPDSSTPDSSTPDSSTPDSSTPDSSTPDSSTPDSFTFDAPDPDAGPPEDSFTFDSPDPDTAPADSFTFDSPDPDTAPADSFTFDTPVDLDGPIGPDADAAAIPPCPINTWCVEPVPVASTLLTGVFAVGVDDVFAVGANGTILRRTNQRWTQMTSNTTQDLAGVWAASATDVWAVGLGGTIRRFDGSTWQTLASGTTVDLNAIWGSGPDDVWIAGVGRVLHWDGQQLASKSLPGTLFAIHGTGPDDVWVTGENALVDHFSNGTWTTGINPGGGTTYFSIHALGTDNVFVGGLFPAKETLQFTGSSWLARPATGCVFQAMFSTSATNLWGVGGTRVGRWNGSTWTVETPAGAAVQLWDVTGIGTHLWVVGSDSLILHRN